MDVHGTAFCFYKHNDFKFKATEPDLCKALNEYELLRDQLSKEREKVIELEHWKKSAIDLWLPIIEYMQNNKNLKLGESISDTVLQVLKHHYEGKEREMRKELVNAVKKFHHYLLGQREYEQLQDLLKKASELDKT